MRIQIASDLHVEMYKQGTMPSIMDIITPSAPFLALLGDIGCPGDQDTFEAYSALLKDLSPNFEQIFVLTGNHEYYVSSESRMSITEIDARIQTLCDSLPNITFLQQKSAIIGNVRIIGATLWSQILEDRKLHVQSGLNDYRRIYVNDNDNVKDDIGKKKRLMSVEDSNEIHFRHLKFIENEIEEAKKCNQKVCVLTHHAPTLHQSCHPRHKDSSVNSAFCTDLDDFIKERQDCINVWAYGHTHYNARRHIGNTLVVANQRGYFFEPKKDRGRGYEETYFVSI